MMTGQIYPWQTALWKIHLGQIIDNKLPHALLLQGYSGLGPEQFGRHLIAAALCLSESDNNSRPCGQCKACLLLEHGNHPDFLLIQAPKPGSAIPVQTVRTIADFLYITSHYGKAKAVLLLTAEAMSYEAANSLLKILEEPPLGSLIVLITQWPSRLPATVRSRCQTIHFPVPSTRETAQWLSTYTDEDIGEIEHKLNNKELPQCPLDAYDVLYSQDKENDSTMKKSFHEDCLNLIESKDIAAVVEKWKDLPPEKVHGWLLEEIQAVIKDYLLKQQPTERLYKLYQFQVDRYKKLKIALNPQLNFESALLEWRSAFIKVS